MPVYIVNQGQQLLQQWPAVGVMTVGVIAGTLLGMIALKRIPEHLFMRVVSLLLVGLGVWLLIKPA